MGVPKFFRWCAERYPTITRNLGCYAPPIDNLYLDVNGIIHNCTHPNDFDALKTAPTEKEMIHAIFIYLERLFNAVQPRKHFLLAVDGVAPRAKMNQQRQRRYRSGYEMMMARQEAIDSGEQVPDEEAVFDSNCITPGTPFMVLVSEKIQYFLANKIANDPAWQQCKIIYSGHDCPGEGEHKILDFIRRRKMEPGYSPNETHCVYGLDADLIMLALASHEPHFVLLREEVKFGNPQQNGKGGEAGGRGTLWKEDSRMQTRDVFVLLDIGILREYFALELNEMCLKAGVPANHDLERFLDDLIFMCFFIGNDFLPSIPTLGINDDSIVEMIQLYVYEVRKKDCYFTHHGKILWENVEPWLKALGMMEMSVIRHRQQEEAQYQKRRERMGDQEARSTLEKTFESIGEYKHHFYAMKHGMKEGYNPESEEMVSIRQDYVDGLTWVMEYYYQGPPSWKWYFAHYYAPMASDLVDLATLGKRVFFEDSKPFLPHQQLLAVLPPMSYRCLPKAYWPLLRSPESPLASVFPEHIEIDREGARAPWEGVVLIPFIDESVLLSAYESVQSQLSAQESKDNNLGPPLLFSYDPTASVDIRDNMFPTLEDAPVSRKEFIMPPECVFVPTLCEGFKIDRILEGFGSLTSPHPRHVRFGKEAVRVFDMPSRKESLILQHDCAPDLGEMGQWIDLLSKEVMAGFPYWQRARLEMLEDSKQKAYRDLRTGELVISKKPPGGTPVGGHGPNAKEDFFQAKGTKHLTFLLQRQGVQLEKVTLTAYVCLFNQMYEDEHGNLRRRFSTSAVEYPIQLVSPLSHLDLVEDDRFKEGPRNPVSGSANTERCIFTREKPSGSDTHQTNFVGALCRVERTEKNEAFVGEKVRYNLRVQLPPFRSIPQSILDVNAAGNWIPSHEIAEGLGLQVNTIRILSGSCTTTPQYGSREFGLPLKYDFQSLSRAGYAKLVRKLSRVDQVTEHSRIPKEAPPENHYLSPKGKGGVDCRRSDGIWLLSAKAVQLLCEYIKRFPPFIRFLESYAVDCRQFDPVEFLRDEWKDRSVDEVLDEMEAFLKSSGVLDAPVISSWEDVISLDEMEQLESVLIEAEKREAAQPNQGRKTAKLSKVPPGMLFFPGSRASGGPLVPLPLSVGRKRLSVFRLGSRVVNCSITGSVPFGATGTIVRFFYARDAEVVYDFPFIGGTRLNGRLKTDRGAVQRLHYLLALPSVQTPTLEMSCAKVLSEQCYSVKACLRRPASPASVSASSRQEEGGKGGAGGRPSTSQGIAGEQQQEMMVDELFSMVKQSGASALRVSPTSLGKGRHVSDFFPPPKPLTQAEQLRAVKESIEKAERERTEREKAEREKAEREKEERERMERERADVIAKAAKPGPKPAEESHVPSPFASAWYPPGCSPPTSALANRHLGGTGGSQTTTIITTSTSSGPPKVVTRTSVNRNLPPTRVVSSSKEKKTDGAPENGEETAIPREFFSKKPLKPNEIKNLFADAMNI